MSDEIKQVIIMRTEFPDGKGGTTGVRKGKMIAQACHASMKFMTDRLRLEKIRFSREEQDWFNGSFAKICVQVKTEEDLLDIYNKARTAGLEVHLITDSGRTEFKVPTRTCLAVGPDRASKIDPITGSLKLL